MPRGKSQQLCHEPLAPGLILGRRRPETAARPMGFVSARLSAGSPPPGDGELLTYGGDGHVITIAPTGTGKTAGPVICNALNHPGQLIVLDIKGEVHHVTARRRRDMG